MAISCRGTTFYPLHFANSSSSPVLPRFTVPFKQRPERIPKTEMIASVSVGGGMRSLKGSGAGVLERLTFDDSSDAFPLIEEDGLCKKGEVEKALDFADVMIFKEQEPNVVSDNTLFSGLHKEDELRRQCIFYNKLFLEGGNLMSYPMGLLFIGCPRKVKLRSTFINEMCKKISLVSEYIGLLMRLKLF